MSKKTKIASATLGAALAAAMMFGIPAVAQQATLSANITPAQMLEQVQASVAAGDIEAALQLIARLRALGVTNIVVNGQVISLASIEQLVISGSPEAIQILASYATAAAASASFAYAPVTSVSTPDSSSSDNFPISSAG